MNTYQAKLVTPFAVLGICTTREWLTALEYLPMSSTPLAPQNQIAETVCAQILTYLEDPSFKFDLPFKFNGTAYQREVWQAINGIPSGQTRSYTDIAQRLGSAPRAVGQACRANRIPIVIPCHRVVAKHGLGGFMGSQTGAPLAIKRWLLQHERV